MQRREPREQVRLAHPFEHLAGRGCRQTHERVDGKDAQRGDDSRPFLTQQPEHDRLGRNDHTDAYRDGKQSDTLEILDVDAAELRPAFRSTVE